MNITCKKNELIGAISIVSKAVDAKPQTPILSGIYLKAEDGKLELHATNYEIGLLVTIDADITSSGTIVVPGRYFQEVVKKLPGEEVTLVHDLSDMSISITSGSASFRLRSMPAGDYPVVKRVQGSLQFTIKDNALRSLIRKTVFACGTDPARPVFTGCSLEVAGTKLTMAATNTHRLAIKEVIFDEDLGKIKLIIPSRILNEVLHTMTSDIPTDILVICSHTSISFSFENLFMTSRLISGQFPDVHNVVPKSFTSEVLLSTQDFSSAVDRVSLISRSNNYNIIRFEFAEDSLHISSNSPDVGRAEETMHISLSGPDLAISFNAQYIMDVLKNIDSENCRMSLGKNAYGAIAIREEKDDSFIYVVTPVRTQN